MWPLSSITVLALTVMPIVPPASSESCTVDYSSHCAEGWAPSMIYERVCTAPISYHGPCATSLPFVDTREDKQHLEKACKISWRCYRDCSPDYDVACPQFWYLSNRLCIPSYAYHGRCKQPIDLARTPEAEKVLWGNRCGVTWPCKRQGKRNYRASCPQGWEHTGNGRCLAPESYRGPCFTKVDLSYFNVKQKQEFEVLCNVNFPDA